MTVRMQSFWKPLSPSGRGSCFGPALAPNAELRRASTPPARLPRPSWSIPAPGAMLLRALGGTDAPPRPSFAAFITRPAPPPAPPRAFSADGLRGPSVCRLLMVGSWRGVFAVCGCRAWLGAFGGGSVARGRGAAEARVWGWVGRAGTRSTHAKVRTLQLSIHQPCRTPCGTGPVHTPAATLRGTPAGVSIPPASAVIPGTSVAPASTSLRLFRPLLPASAGPAQALRTRDAASPAASRPPVTGTHTTHNSTIRQARPGA
eukprot:354461-Chlamydomonas_euryale.AAC.3